MKTTLYELTWQYEQLMELACGDVDDTASGLTDPMVQVLEEIEDDIDTKLVGCCKALKSMVCVSKAIEAERKALKDREERIERHVEQLKEYIRHNMERMEWTKRNAGPFRLSIVNNSQPSVHILDLEAVPSKFDKIAEREVSLTQIKIAIDKGEQVPGVELVRGKHLRVS